MEIRIGGLQFKTKKELTEFTRNVRDDYKTGQHITGPDKTFLINLLLRHPWAEQKIGCGIDYFYTAYTEYRTKCFYIMRPDGTHTDFSFHDCINPKTCYKKDFIKACRVAISGQILSWKEINNTDKCVKCGAVEPCEVDHYPVMFKDILKGFVDQNNIKDFQPLVDCKNWDDVEGVYISDEDMLVAWQQYHAKNASYRSLCHKCNSDWRE